MSERFRNGIAEARAIERLLRPRILAPALTAVLFIMLVQNAPRLLPTRGARVEAIPNERRPVVVASASNRVAAHAAFTPESRPVRIERHVFIPLQGVPPGRVAARFRLAPLPGDRRTPQRYRCFWTTGGWAFQPEQFSWLTFEGDWLVSEPFDPSPEQTARYELRLRLDFMERAEIADVLEAQVVQHFSETASVSPKVQARTAWLAELGAPLVLEVEPWGSGTFASSVGFRVRSPRAEPIPVEVVASVEDGARGWQEAARLALPDVTRRHTYSPEWVDIRLDLGAWRGRRTRVSLLARPLDPGSSPEFVDVYWEVGRTY